MAFYGSEVLENLGLPINHNESVAMKLGVRIPD
jgi:hypothetical protein